MQGQAFVQSCNHTVTLSYFHEINAYCALTFAEAAMGHLASGLALPLGFAWSAAFSLLMASFTVSPAAKKMDQNVFICGEK